MNLFENGGTRGHHLDMSARMFSKQVKHLLNCNL